ncbi:MAG TPA: hypothetical protein EYQ50_28770 [Verrucomicrobiales bacterium]|nr:hypothetical protein [Verrucomicrobiales bacterium]HIL72169.1 hypothetical protein [Verrucomicrobiota bacterium]
MKILRYLTIILLVIQVACRVNDLNVDDSSPLGRVDTQGAATGDLVGGASEGGLSEIPDSVIEKGKRLPFIVEPSFRIKGEVASIYPELRFVVLDFNLQAMPVVGESLVVYRNGHKVAEVKASGFFRDSKIAADILTGEPRKGDEVWVEPK